MKRLLRILKRNAMMILSFVWIVGFSVLLAAYIVWAIGTLGLL